MKYVKLVIEFVNECTKRGITSQWDCVESNPISKRLAEKAGFINNRREKYG